MQTMLASMLNYSEIDDLEKFRRLFSIALKQRRIENGTTLSQHKKSLRVENIIPNITVHAKSTRLNKPNFKLI